MALDRLEERPSAVLSTPEGTAPPLWLRIVRLPFVRGGQLNKRIARAVGWRIRLPRLMPELCAHYPDGRRFLVPPRDHMYAHIFAVGEYERANTALVQSVLRSGDFAIDVGANHGWFTLVMAVRVGDRGTVWAYEPVPPIVERLRANLRLNPGLAVEVRDRALGAKATRGSIHLFRDLPAGHASQSNLGRSDFDRYEIEVVPLDQELVGAPSAPALVKVDVEGAELDVLQGASNLLRRAPPMWLLEVNWETSRVLGYQPPDLLEMLAGSYDVFRITDRGLIRDTDPTSAPQNSSWLCVPDRFASRVAPLRVPR